MNDREKVQIKGWMILNGPLVWRYHDRGLPEAKKLIKAWKENNWRKFAKGIESFELAIPNEVEGE